MTTLVTGGAGYIGSHMVRYLQEQGRAVVVLDDLSTGHRWAVPDGLLEVADLTDRAAVEAVFARYDIEAVIHFAASSLVGESRRLPLAYYENNVGGTLNLVHACLKRGVERFVFSSTAAVYGEPGVDLIAEDQALHPINPYGATKAACERLLMDVGIPHVSLRYFNAAGAAPDAQLGECHEPETHLIPRVLQAASGRGDEITVFGEDYPTPDGTCVRDYIHVQDLVQAHALALDYLESGGGSRAFNCGYGRGYSVRDVIDACSQVTGRTIPVSYGPRREGDPPRLVADGSALRQMMGWEPAYDDLETIVADAWRWEQALASKQP
ncbi:UDP-glucose 4-epimerase GalE [Thioalkalivibrio sp. ALJ3]|uniref:UDP-glucose 4-epimerase GalE n=1 Tax=Thioalkalivibrio sp. ALJ3 TaxID=1240557 RepID=UPI00037C14C8|nr:UDP-glucose 4-epimerase GalE [Thioalkalivibrio sp. ALJ3]